MKFKDFHRLRRAIPHVVFLTAIFAAADYGPGFGRTASTVRAVVWPTSLNLSIGGTAEVFAAALLDDGTVTCNPPVPFVWTSSDTSIATVRANRVVAEDDPGCLAAKALLQDTVPRVVMFSWPRLSGMDEYNIVVTNASTFMSGLDTIVVADTSLMWGAGAPDSLYWVKGAARYRGIQLSFGDSVQFSFPTPVVAIPLGPIVVDTVP